MFTIIGIAVRIGAIIGGYLMENGNIKVLLEHCFFFFSSRRRHTRLQGDWSSDVCSSDLNAFVMGILYHFKKIWIKIGFTLEVKDQVEQFFMNIINCLLEKILVQHACRSCKIGRASCRERV